MKKFLTFLIISTFTLQFPAFAQNKIQSISLSTAFATNQFSTALNYQYAWMLGKKKQWTIGTGARFTSSFENKLFYITAPAILTSGKKGPAVFFADQINKNIDSIYFLKAQTNALNVTVNFGYKINEKFNVGFNIDAIGFSFGGNKGATYYSNSGSVAATTAKPTSFNLLLVSDNDLGTLNSEFFGQYNFNKKWGAKLGFQFLFTEFTTATKVQTTPDGQKNDRFRYKAGGVSLGVNYNL